MMKLWMTLFILTFSSIASANQTCSRFATINYQKVLVDAGSTKKGEGLRFYLEKDPRSKELLDEYQEFYKPSFIRASASTLGSLFIIGSFLQTGNSPETEQKKTGLLYGGVLLVALSYLSSQTARYGNERLLEQSINQYNKRNSPRIYFSPFKAKESSGVGLGYEQEF